MTKKKKETCRILSQTRIATGIFDLRVESSMAESVVPGQFAGLYVPNAAKLLPRPISICDADEKTGCLRFVYRVKEGEAGSESGTAEISRLKAGDTIDILGLLGNGYDLREAEGKKVAILGGGIGIPPMLFLTKKLSAAFAKTSTKNQPAAFTVIMGYRDRETFLADEFERCGELRIATDDGSVGTHGTVIDVLNAGIQAEVIFACGPLPMLKAVKDYAANIRGDKATKAYISLEERMACGVGVCLGCVTRTAHEDAHSRVRNARICTDGPVFDADAVVL